MKKYMIVCLAIAMVMTFGTIAMAGTDPGTGIQGSKHDLSTGGSTIGGPYVGTGADDALDRICIYCHTPHHAMKASEAQSFASGSIVYFPLWNHDITTLSYVTYTNTYSGLGIPNSTQHQFNGELSIGQPGSISRLCLSCHDGSVALSAYGNLGGGVNPTKGNAAGTVISGPMGFQIGADMGGGVGDLSNHHPIGFNYRSVAALDDEIADPDATPVASLDPTMFVKDLLWGDKMECSSCHDVHNTKNAGSKFTWVEDYQSAFCLTCHVK